VPTALTSLQSQINFITANNINQSLQNKTALKIAFGAVFLLNLKNIFTL
jgi:hypothetical protein